MALATLQGFEVGPGLPLFLPASRRQHRRTREIAFPHSRVGSSSPPQVHPRLSPLQASWTVHSRCLLAETAFGSALASSIGSAPMETSPSHTRPRGCVVVLAGRILFRLRALVGALTVFSGPGVRGCCASPLPWGSPRFRCSAGPGGVFTLRCVGAHSTSPAFASLVWRKTSPCGEASH